MRITDLHIERFGTWQNLHLSLPNPGLNVMYGPNEAGKSTLLRFIRGVLFGYPPEFAGGLSSGSSGGLDIEFRGSRYYLQRTAVPHSRGSLSVSSREGQLVPEHFSDQLLQGITEPLYEQIFAVGLGELQELALLQAGDVADRIYGLTLGPDGQRLITAGSRHQSRKQALFDPAQKQGRLAELQQHHDRITAELRQADRNLRRHRELSRERTQIEDRIDDIKSRQTALTRELRGQLLLQRVWGPWNEVRELHVELAELAPVHGFPEEGISRFERIETDLTAAQKSRDDLVARARKTRQQAAQLSLDRDLRHHAAAIQGLLDQRDWIEHVTQQATQARQQADALKRELDQQLEALGPPWTARRLENFDVSPAAQFRLINMSRSFRGALARRARCERAVNRLEQWCGTETDALQQSLSAVRCDSLSEALPLARKQLQHLDKIRQLKLHQQGLLQRQEGIDEERERLEGLLYLPPWVYLVLGGFGISAIALLLAGINKGLTLSIVVGAVYGLLVITCGGLCWALKNHFERDTQLRLEDINEEADENRRDLTATHEQARMLITTELLALNKASGRTAEQFSEADLIQHLTQRIAELERLERQEDLLNRRRIRLHDLRVKLQQHTREVGTARQNWQAHLTSLGFPGTLNVEEAHAAWKQVAVACELKQRLDLTQQAAARHQEIVTAFHVRIQEVGRRMNRFEIEPQQAEEVLRNWEAQLLRHAEQRETRRELRKQARGFLREAADYLALMHDLKTQRAALLVQAGAENRDHFLERAALAERRHEVVEQLTGAQHELELASQTSSDLAVAEEDLRRLDTDENREQIVTLRQELADLETDLATTYEQLGSLKLELKQLEASCTVHQLRFDQEQIESQLREAAADWLATELAGQALQGLRTVFERTCQPVTLADASRHLSRLTHGRYRNVWTPLGERQLCVDDEQHQTWTVDQLSRGTREQLFLAVRMALVEELARQGVHLPMILDDVLVNFDQTRAMAAIDLLHDFANRGHQVLLLTCHRVLAEREDELGRQPIWLQRPIVPNAERLAG